MKAASIKRSLILLLVLLVGDALAAPDPALACSCIEPGPPQAAFAAAEAVFAGRVVHVPPPPAAGVYSSADLIPVEFEVARVWKGPADPALTVYTERSGVSCGYSFESGQDYLVYAQVRGALLRTGLCTRTARLAAAAEDLAALGDGRAPAVALPAAGTPEGRDALPWFGLVVAAVLMALALVTVLLLLRRQNYSKRR